MLSKPEANGRSRRILLLMSFAVLLSLLIAGPSLVVLFRDMSEDKGSGSGRTRAPFAATMTSPTTGDEDAVVVGEECSCFDSNASQACCRREVLRAHKFGFILAATLFRAPRERGDVVITWEIEPSGLFSKGSGTEEGGDGGTMDYRHVVTARNFTEALVSGYLYHRTGRECWSTLGGRSVAPAVEGLMDWPGPVNELRATYPAMGAQPAAQNRSLCRVLADESEEDGMTIYIAYALKHWYRRLSSYLQVARQRERDGVKKSMFVCLEDLSDPKRERELYDAMIDFLFPGGHSYPYPRKVTTSGAKPYSGGHATNPEPRLLGRLVELVRKLDEDVFKNHLYSVDAMIGCSGTIH
jgi:hypothetical protein